MISIVCPVCGSTELKLIGDGVYKCMVCGYTGDASGKSILLK